MQPEGYALEQAIRWIREELKQVPKKPIGKLIQEAGRKFDLSPKDEEFLHRQFKRP